MQIPSKYFGAGSTPAQARLGFRRKKRALYLLSSSNGSDTRFSAGECEFNSHREYQQSKSTDSRHYYLYFPDFGFDIPAGALQRLHFIQQKKKREE